MLARQVRGCEIAGRGMIRQAGAWWLVPSQSGRGRYVMDVESLPPTCSCPDYELHGVKCKHIYAVEVLMQGRADVQAPLSGATEPKLKKPTYRQDWPAYNAAQTNEKAHFQALLHALCRDVEEPTYIFGRPRLPLREMIFAAAFKVYSTVSCRRFMCDLADARDKGYLSRAPHFNSIFNYLELPEMTAVLRELIERSSLPMRAVETHFAVDSSGFTSCQYARWFDAKYGQEVEQEERDWMKVHLMCGVTTNIVTAVEITPRYGADYPQFRPLVQATGRNFRMQEVSADKAYSGRANLELVYKHGASPYIPFRSNATGRMSSMDTWDQLFHFYHLHRETFLQHYHRRSLVESTFSMIKAKFGAAIRSKGEVAQVNELLCKVLCHNICVLIQSMYELGIEPEF